MADAAVDVVRRDQIRVPLGSDHTTSAHEAFSLQKSLRTAFWMKPLVGSRFGNAAFLTVLTNP